MLLGCCRRLTAAVCVLIVCGLLSLSGAAPAVAIGSSPSMPSEGAAELNAIQGAAEEAVESAPRNAKKVQKKSKEGLNGVQGDANASKQNRPSNSSEATTVSEKIQNAFEPLSSD